MTLPTPSGLSSQLLQSIIIFANSTIGGNNYIPIAMHVAGAESKTVVDKGRVDHVVLLGSV